MDKKYYYIGGGALLLIGAWLFFGSRQKSAQEAPAQNGSNVGIGNSPQPVFVSGGGGGVTSQPAGASANLPLGGGTWQQPILPLGENPDVEIAKINAGIAAAQIKAQEAIANLMFAPAAPAPATKAKFSDVVSYLSNEIKKPGGITPVDAVRISEDARKFGVDAAGVAAGLNIASGTKQYTAANVNEYLAGLGLPGL